MKHWLGHFISCCVDIFFFRLSSNQDIFFFFVNGMRLFGFQSWYFSFSTSLHNNSTTIFTLFLLVFIFICTTTYYYSLSFIFVMLTFHLVYCHFANCQLRLGQFLCHKQYVNLAAIWTILYVYTVNLTRAKKKNEESNPKKKE